MAIGYTGQQPPADELCPSVGRDLGTGKAEAGFAGEGHSACLPTITAAILHIAHFAGVATVEHFPDGLVVIRDVKAWIGLLESIPISIEDLLKRVVSMPCMAVLSAQPYLIWKGSSRKELRCLSSKD